MIVFIRLAVVIFLVTPLAWCCSDGAPQPHQPVEWQTVNDSYGLRQGCRGYDYYRPAFEQVEWTQE